MPEAAVVEGSADTGVQDQDKTVQAPSEESGSGGEEKLIFDKYKDMEAAKQGMHDLERGYAQAREEKAVQDREIEHLKQEVQLAQAVESFKQLAQSQTAKGEDSPDYDKYMESIVEKAREDAGAGLQDAVTMLSTWQQRDRDGIQKDIKSLKSELAEELAKVRAQQEKLTPDYLENQELVDSLVNDGMEIKAAKKWAKKIKADTTPTQPPRETPPAMINGTRVTSTGGGAPKPYISDAEWVSIKETNPELSDEDRAEMEATQKRNVEMDAAERQAREGAR